MTLPFLALMSPRLLENIAAVYIRLTSKGTPARLDDSFIRKAQEVLNKLGDASRFSVGTTPH
jgi:hypothetical protein